jgi:hypothetical protein
MPFDAAFNYYWQHAASLLGYANALTSDNLWSIFHEQNRVSELRALEGMEGQQGQDLRHAIETVHTGEGGTMSTITANEVPRQGQLATTSEDASTGAATAITAPMTDAQSQASLLTLLLSVPSDEGDVPSSGPTQSAPAPVMAEEETPVLSGDSFLPVPLVSQPDVDTVGSTQSLPLASDTCDPLAPLPATYVEHKGCCEIL